MKTKEEFEAPNKKLAELSEAELNQVIGGTDKQDIKNCPQKRSFPDDTCVGCQHCQELSASDMYHCTVYKRSFCADF